MIVTLAFTWTALILDARVIEYAISADRIFMLVTRSPELERIALFACAVELAHCPFSLQLLSHGLPDAFVTELTKCFAQAILSSAKSCDRFDERSDIDVRFRFKHVSLEPIPPRMLFRAQH